MRYAIMIIISYDTPHNGFRYFALQKGKELGIAGTIADNSSSGGISIHAEARNSVLQKYISILRLGSPFCKVKSIMVIPDRMLNCLYFEIIPAQVVNKENLTKKGKTGNFRIGFFGL